MKILRPPPRPDDAHARAVTIGNFDGVHRGHRALLRALGATARTQGLRSCVLTFEPHPREFFAPASAPLRISTLRDRLEAIAAAGIDETCVLRFDASLASMPATGFIDGLLAERLHTRRLIVGEDFRFGARRLGDVALLRSRGAMRGFDTESFDPVIDDGLRISSTAVRAALADGRFAQAAALLGRPYRVSGHVVHGRRLGRTLDMPTMNVRFPGPRGHAAHPAAHGVDVVRVHGLGPLPLPGVSSFGMRPAVETGGRPLLEVHLLAGGQNAYGRLIRVEFLHRLRGERHFASLDELKASMDHDRTQARDWFRHHDVARQQPTDPEQQQTGAEHPTDPDGPHRSTDTDPDGPQRFTGTDPDGPRRPADPDDPRRPTDPDPADARRAR